MQNESSEPTTIDLLPGRRTFFGQMTYGLGVVASAVLGLPVVQYFLGTMPRKVIWVPVGAADSFQLETTRMITFDNPIRQPWDGKLSQTGVFVRFQGYDDQRKPQFLVLAVNCAHLGCPVSWFPQSGLFMCPCHGGVYHANGDRAAGPPTRGLFRCDWRLNGGQLEIQAPHYPTLQDTLDKKRDPGSLAARESRCNHA